MKILITGAAGFVGKNLTAALENIRDGKDRTHPALQIEKLWLNVYMPCANIGTKKDPFSCCTELIGEIARSYPKSTLLFPSVTDPSLDYIHHPSLLRV